MRLRIGLLFVAICAVTSALWAQEVWDKKPAAEWSEKDAKKIMEDSPWANKWMTVVPVISQTGSSSDSFDRDTTKEMWYRAQFWSALPMRQARVRSMQIQAGYNKMKPEDKTIFDERSKQFIEAPQESIVVRVTYGSNVQDFERKMSRYWHEQTLDLQKNLIVLIADGKRIPIENLQQTQQGSPEFYVTFPRMIDGKPVIAGPNSKVGIEMQHPDVAGPQATSTAVPGGSRVQPTSGSTNQGQTTAAQLNPGKNSERVFIQFKPSKMMYNGQMAF